MIESKTCGCETFKCDKHKGTTRSKRDKHLGTKKVCFSVVLLFTGIDHLYLCGLWSGATLSGKHQHPSRRLYMHVGSANSFSSSSETTEIALRSFVGECFVPLLNVIHPHDHEMINRVKAKQFFLKKLIKENGFLISQCMCYFRLQIHFLRW